MRFAIPQALRAEHEELHETLVRATKAPGALARLRAAARAAGQAEYASFADALVLHAQTEEQVLYPAAILVGEYVEHALKEASAAH